MGAHIVHETVPLKRHYTTVEAKVGAPEPYLAGPVQKTIHYGTEHRVTGHSSVIHKPQIHAPPSAFQPHSSTASTTTQLRSASTHTTSMSRNQFQTQSQLRLRSSESQLLSMWRLRELRSLSTNMPLQFTPTARLLITLTLLHHTTPLLLHPTTDTLHSQLYKHSLMQDMQHSQPSQHSIHITPSLPLQRSTKSRITFRK